MVMLRFWSFLKSNDKYTKVNLCYIPYFCMNIFLNWKLVLKAKQTFLIYPCLIGQLELTTKFSFIKCDVLEPYSKINKYIIELYAFVITAPNN